MFFILSTGRSGTTTIAQTLSLIQGCLCLHEPPPELILESSAFHYGEFPPDKLKEILLKTRRLKADSAVYCESNQTLSLIVPVLAEAFPGARYIWLIRNGLDVVASTYQKQWYTGHSENHDRYEDCSAIEKAWIDGRIRGDRCGDMSTDEWTGLDRFGKCCWYWGYVNRVIARDLDAYAHDGFFILLLEEIESRLKDLVEWMGLKAAIIPSAGFSNIAKRRPYHWTEWTSQEREIFEHFCGSLMDRFYPSWRTDAGEWKGIEYCSKKGIWDSIRNNHVFVKKINSLFARNLLL